MSAADGKVSNRRPPSGFGVGQFVRRAPQGQPWEVLGEAVDAFNRHGLVVCLRSRDGHITCREFVLDADPLYLHT